MVRNRNRSQLELGNAMDRARKVQMARSALVMPSALSHRNLAKEGRSSVKIVAQEDSYTETQKQRHSIHILRQSLLDRVNTQREIKDSDKEDQVLEEEEEEEEEEEDKDKEEEEGGRGDKGDAGDDRRQREERSQMDVENAASISSRPGSSSKEENNDGSGSLSITDKQPRLKKTLVNGMEMLRERNNVFAVLNAKMKSECAYIVKILKRDHDCQWASVCTTGRRLMNAVNSYAQGRCQATEATTATR